MVSPSRGFVEGGMAPKVRDCRLPFVNMFSFEVARHLTASYQFERRWDVANGRDRDEQPEGPLGRLVRKCD